MNVKKETPMRDPTADDVLVRLREATALAKKLRAMARELAHCETDPDSVLYSQLAELRETLNETGRNFSFLHADMWNSALPSVRDELKRAYDAGATRARMTINEKG